MVPGAGPLVGVAMEREILLHLGLKVHPLVQILVCLALEPEHLAVRELQCLALETRPAASHRCLAEWVRQ
ncbi:hypothetical protein CYMTET_45804 [Cymbomonas tetramitiformis]|uniref:Uncharacterized protein n=1 Tax=Cymbomonas tetramitiformis TaxID=36881 RepID=A0AAE0BXH1_9CHLO|nr:hypothetical protein CYMTET_45804 [Cymbomonas tetramitiformis]